MDNQIKADGDCFSNHNFEFKRDRYDDGLMIYCEKELSDENAIEKIYDSAGELTDNFILQLLNWNEWYMQAAEGSRVELEVVGEGIVDFDYKTTVIEHLGNVIDETDYLWGMVTWIDILPVAWEANDFPATFREVCYGSYLEATMDFARGLCCALIGACGEVGWTSRHVPGLSLHDIDTREAKEPISETLLMKNFHEISRLISDSSLATTMDLNYLGNHIAKERMRILRIARERKGVHESQSIPSGKKTTHIEGLESGDRVLFRDNKESSFLSAAKQWALVECLLEAGSMGLTREEVREKLRYSKADDGSLTNLKDVANIKLRKLKVKIEPGGNNWKLAVTGLTQDSSKIDLIRDKS